MSSEIAIAARGLSKSYPIFNKPEDRLKQMLSFGRRKYYREFWAVKDVDLEVHRGETVGIVGHNGSGKSTLLQMICGTLTPTSGELTVRGRVAALLELGAGFNPEFTGRENVYMNGAVLGLTKEQINACFDDITAFADIGEFIEQPVKTYSSGMYVRLAFAVAAHVDADILIVDEALAVGDHIFQQKCMRFLRNFMKKGTVLFASHDMGAVKNLCNRALWLEHGEPRLLGEVKEICDKYLEASVEAQQGTSDVGVQSAKMANTGRPRPVFDQRLKYINASKYRNDIEVFAFDPQASGFGKGGATIIDVQMLDEGERPLSWVIGGELAILSVRVQAEREIEKPIVGFYIKDRLGQYLFGDNTFLSHRDEDKHLSVGDMLEARFKFQMPLLPRGKYSICAAIAEGTQENHIQRHWIHDALFFESHVNPLHQFGLVGLPMLDISLNVVNDQDFRESAVANEGNAG